MRADRQSTALWDEEYAKNTFQQETAGPRKQTDARLIQTTEGTKSCINQTPQHPAVCVCVFYYKLSCWISVVLSWVSWPSFYIGHQVAGKLAAVFCIIGDAWFLAGLRWSFTGSSWSLDSLDLLETTYHFPKHSQVLKLGFWMSCGVTCFMGGTILNRILPF